MVFISAFRLLSPFTTSSLLEGCGVSLFKGGPSIKRLGNSLRKNIRLALDDISFAECCSVDAQILTSLKKYHVLTMRCMPSCPSDHESRRGFNKSCCSVYVLHVSIQWSSSRL